MCVCYKVQGLKPDESESLSSEDLSLLERDPICMRTMILADK